MTQTLERQRTAIDEHRGSTGAAAAAGPLLETLSGPASVRFTFWDGTTWGPTVADVTIHLRSVDALRRFLWSPGELGLGRAFVANVVVVTISPEQQAVTQKRVKEMGLAEQIEIRLQDYRELGGEQFDAISSIGAMENAGFEVRVVESLREHYALTLRQWIANLESNWDAAVALVGAGRGRTWRLYMAGSAVGFEEGGLGVHQVLGVLPRADGVSGMNPTRDRSATV